MEPCGACLSRGRRVTALGAARAARVLRAAAEGSPGASLPPQDVDATLLSRLAVCWECRTFVEKSIVFCERVRRAQTALRNENLAVLTESEDNAASMSTLGLSTKIGFDFVYNFPEPEDVKCGLNETDIATSSSQETESLWDVSMSPSTLFPVTGLEEINGEVGKISKIEEKMEADYGDDAEDGIDDNLGVKGKDNNIEIKVQDTDENIEMKVQDTDENIEIKVQDTDENIEMKVRDTDEIQTVVGDDIDIDTKDDLGPMLKNNFCIIMRDLTKQPKKYKTNKITYIEPSSLTIKRINGDEIEELKAIKPSELKTRLFQRSANKKKPGDTMKNLAKSGVTIKMTTALDDYPQRPSKVKTVFMSEDEMQQSRDEERNNEHYVKSLFKCETCIVGFMNKAFLEDHNKSKHRLELGEFACDICSLRFPRADSVAWHRKTHYHLYVCKCGYTQRHLADVNRHYAAVHEPVRTYPCQQCDEVFAKQRQLRYHKEKVHFEVKKCTQCDKTFTSRSSYVRHAELHTGTPVYACAVCDKSVRGKALLRAHMRVHEPEDAPELAFCAECNLQFKNKYLYRAHLRYSLKHVSREDLKHLCDKCDKRFMSPGELRRHCDLVHLNKQLFRCEQCDKNYSNPQGLKKHQQKIHEGIQPEKNKFCELCGKGFSTTGILATHRRIHTGERPYRCTVCATTFRQSGALYKHNELVHGERANNR